MADHAGERTEAPTPRRRQEAREKGQVARSGDLSSAVLLLGGMIALRMFGMNTMAALMQAMRENLSVSDPAVGRNLDVSQLVITTGMIVLTAAGPFLLAVVLIALVSNLVQVGAIFSTQPLAPQLERLNPLNGVGRLFNTRTIVQLAMNLLKLMIVCLVAYVTIHRRLGDLMLAMALEGWSQVGLLSSVLYELGLKLALVLLVLALFDFAWQKLKLERDLRMTRQEVKEEMRRMDGDPIIKQRRRKMQLAAAMQRIRKMVPTADVVVTNPTELAIAIKYDSEKMTAPRVVAKGADYLAKKIRELAALHGIPIVERKPLAQALYKNVEVGQEVPEQFYKAIAEILAYVYQLSGKKMKERAA
ncbi:MAG TPA: flagellar biosynthesis protein FlhB [Phycisphaerae bacterium]|nr:flagellar biosynthesis protein FlhB [Phycisphaerae bacterium]